MSRELLTIAKHAATTAATLLRGAQVTSIRSKKNPRDIVTEWDLRAEEAIRGVLAETGFPILGEEEGETSGRDASMRWLVDPIDGTVNFSHGLPIWGISIAVEVVATHQVVAGIVLAPALGWSFEAAAGQGAFDQDGAPLQVSTIGTLADALLTTGFPYDRATNPANNFDQFVHMKKVSTVRRLGAASIDLCLVARGALDGYWERRLQPWDLAAGALIVVEAGGNVTNSHGGPFDVHSGEAVATNGAIHAELVSELAKVGR